MKNKLPLIFFAFCLVWWVALAAYNVMAETGSFQIKNGKLVVKNGKAGTTVATTTTTTIPPDYVPTNGLLAYYKFDGSIRDEISGGVGVILPSRAPVYTTNLPSVVQAQGYGQSIDFTSTDFYGCQLTNATLSNGKSDVSIAFWVRFAERVSYYSLVTADGNSTFGFNGIEYDDDYGYFRASMIYSGGWIYAPSANWEPVFPSDTWLHFAYTVAAGDKLRLYTNGVLRSESSGNAGGTIVQAKNYHVNCWWHQESQARAMWSQVLIYDRVLTTNEIYRLVTGN